MAKRPYRPRYFWGARAPGEPTDCQRCGARVRALVYDGWPRKLDAAELNLLGELDALFRGLQTWAYYGEYTYRRSAHLIREAPKAGGAFLYRDHDCNIPAPTLFALALPGKEYSGGEPPF